MYYGPSWPGGASRMRRRDQHKSQRVRLGAGQSEQLELSDSRAWWTRLSDELYARWKAFAACRDRAVGWAEAPANAPSKGAYRFDPKTYSWVHKKTGKKTLGAAPSGK